ncbi:MAG: hypothetical protein AAF411_12415 [Myxococcota bacterium]
MHRTFLSFALTAFILACASSAQAQELASADVTRADALAELHLEQETLRLSMLELQEHPTYVRGRRLKWGSLVVGASFLGPVAFYALSWLGECPIDATGERNCGPTRFQRRFGLGLAAVAPLMIGTAVALLVRGIRLRRSVMAEVEEAWEENRRQIRQVRAW